MNRIDTLLSKTGSNPYSVFFTAGFPVLDSTLGVIQQLQQSGVDMVIVGMPFSDPLADGPDVKHSNKVALNNGMSIEVLFSQLKTLRETVSIPVVLMGYFNPVLQFGVELFLSQCQACGIDGVIIPDMPLDIFDDQYAKAFSDKGICNILLAIPTANLERIELLAKRSQGFLYLVSMGGEQDSKAMEQLSAAVALASKYRPVLIGFGDSTQNDFALATRHGAGAVVSSAFVKMLGQSKNLTADIDSFVRSMIGKCVNSASG